MEEESMELTREHYERAATAYNVYCQHLGDMWRLGKRPPFQELPQDTKDAWAAAVIALSVSDDKEARRSTAGLCADIAEEIGAAEFTMNTGYCAGSAIASEIRKRFSLSAPESESGNRDKCHRGCNYPDHWRGGNDKA